jgi:hypothetical protein
MDEWRIKFPFSGDKNNLLYIEGNYNLEIMFVKGDTTIVYNCKKNVFLEFVIKGLLMDENKLIIDRENDLFQYIFVTDNEKLIINGRGGENIYNECFCLMKKAGVILL